MGATITSADGVSVTVAEPRLRKIIYTPDVGSLAHAYPAGRTGSQFLVVSVSSPDGDVTSLRLAPVLDGARRDGRGYRLAFTPGSSARLGFRVPVVRTASGAVEWRPSSGERYRWELPDPVVTDIGISPRFEVTEFAVSETIARDEPFTASLAVSNVGERDGRFLAVVLDDTSASVPLVSEFAIPVAVGETVTRDLSGRAVTAEQSSVTAILDWGVDERRASFAIVD